MLNIAWIEYGAPQDGIAFLRGLSDNKKIGNLFNLLLDRQSNVRNKKSISSTFRRISPYIKKDIFCIPVEPKKKEIYWPGNSKIDFMHPFLPINRKGSHLMILPSEKVEIKLGVFRDRVEPLYTLFRVHWGNISTATKDDDEFTKLLRCQNNFLSKWMFSPGLKSESSGVKYLTTSTDFNYSAKIVAISGHGAGPSINGGGESIHIFKTLYEWVLPGDSERPSPYYIIFPSCNMLADDFVIEWLLAFSQTNPIRGLLGYSRSFSSKGQVREKIFTNFSIELKKRKRFIWEAWLNAQEPVSKYSSCAIIHKEAMDDTLESLQGIVKYPTSGGEVFNLHFERGNNKPIKEVVKPKRARINVCFIINGIEVKSHNKMHNGLEPEKVILIRITPDLEPLCHEKWLKLIFNYYRPDKPGLDIRKLFNLDNWESNKNHRILYDQRSVHFPGYYWVDEEEHERKNADALAIYIEKEIKELEIELQVNKKATDVLSYTIQGTHEGRNHYGYFWIKAFMDHWEDREEKAKYKECLQEPDGAIPFRRNGVFLYDLK